MHIEMDSPENAVLHVKLEVVLMIRGQTGNRETPRDMAWKGFHTFYTKSDQPRFKEQLTSWLIDY